jgi:hypothetical protein
MVLGECLGLVQALVGDLSASCQARLAEVATIISVALQERHQRILSVKENMPTFCNEVIVRRLSSSCDVYIAEVGLRNLKKAWLDGTNTCNFIIETSTTSNICELITGHRFYVIQSSGSGRAIWQPASQFRWNISRSQFRHLSRCFYILRVDFCVNGETTTICHKRWGKARWSVGSAGWPKVGPTTKRRKSQ